MSSNHPADQRDEPSTIIGQPQVSDQQASSNRIQFPVRVLNIHGVTYMRLEDIMQHVSPQIMDMIRHQLVIDEIPAGIYIYPDSDTPSTGNSEGQSQDNEVSGEAEHIEDLSDPLSASDAVGLEDTQASVEAVAAGAGDHAADVSDDWSQAAQDAGWGEHQQENGWDEPQQDNRWDEPQQGNGWNEPQANNGWGESQQDNGWDEPQQADQRDLDKCPGCMDRLSRPEGVVIECGHSWHGECLNDNFLNALQSRNNWPAKCCCSSERIDHSSIQQYLDDYVLQLLFARVEEFESPSPIFCSNLSCGEFIPDGIVDNGQTYWVNCPECQMTTCKLCKCPSLQHSMPGVCPTFLSAENEQLAEQEGWKVCPRPGCSTIIDRSDGCDTIECPGCKTEFCYRCGRLLRDGVPCNCAGQNQWVEEPGQFV